MREPTRGATLLRDLVSPKTHTQASVARDVGVTPEAVRHWAVGFSKPKPELREELERLLGIPASSWDETERDEPSKVA